MVQKKSKNKDIKDQSLVPLNNATLARIESKLERRREELKEKLENIQKKSAGLRNDTGFFTVCATSAFAFDWIIMGGIGSGLATLGAWFWSEKVLEIRRIQKELHKIEEKLEALDDKRIEAELIVLRNQPRKTDPARDNFNVAALQEKVKEIESQVKDLTDPKPVRIDKPEQ